MLMCRLQHVGPLTVICSKFELSEFILKLYSNCDHALGLAYT